ncbi:hypothetical protein GCM10027416_05790 [Okibacterium endophyticum]
MKTLATLLDLERQLAAGRGAVYSEILADDALVIVPGAILDKQECVVAMDSSPGWDATELSEARLTTCGDAHTLIYRFAGKRGNERYTATLASTYVRRDRQWHLLLHQHTPDPVG